MTELKDIFDAATAFIPEKYRALAVLLGLGLVKYSPLITRSIYALINGRGIKGVLSAIWLGTNTPKAAANAGQQADSQDAEPGSAGTPAGGAGGTTSPPAK